MLTVKNAAKIQPSETVPREGWQTICARFVPEDVASGDLSDSAYSGISNLRVSNTG
jgi:hypothetical protein